MRWFAAVRRLIDRHPFASDAALAAALAIFVLGDIATSTGYYTGPMGVYLPTAALMTLPLAWRRRAPLAVLVVVMGALIVLSLGVGSDPTPDSPLAAWLIAIYTVAAHCERAKALLGGAISMAAGLIWLGVDDFLLPVVVFGGAWLAGRLVSQRQDYAVAMQERAEALEREREANARAAASDERARIARELHDVLAHSLSVIVVQAGAERIAPAAGGSAAIETLEAIEQTGREALAEMRRLLGVLRAGGEALPREPQPTLAELERLVSQVREAGVPVELHVEGEPVPVPTGVAVSAYRIVQEALTNVIKHAGPAHARVVVRYGRRELELEVQDDGRGPTASGDNGHGLVGMRERAALYGGELVASAGAAGGFVIRARLPFDALAS